MLVGEGGRGKQRKPPFTGLDIQQCIVYTEHKYCVQEGYIIVLVGGGEGGGEATQAPIYRARYSAMHCLY